MNDSRSRIMGASTPGYSFLQVGQSVTGQIITEPKDVQQRNFHDGSPAFWPSGDPKMQTVFQIQTSLRNYEGISQPDRSKPDDGVRSLFIKGKHMERAVKDAILAAGASWLDIGGWIQVTYTGDDMSSKAASKPKFFAVKYQPGPPQAPQQPAPQAPYGGYNSAQQNFNTGVAQATSAQQSWQQPGWQPNGPAAPPAYPNQPPAFPQPPAVTQPVVPSHHGSLDTMPAWAGGPSSAPPAPSSAPPAPPALSTLQMIAQAQQTSGSPDYGSVEPAF